MSPRNLFVIILKIMGILALKEVIVSATTVFYYFIAATGGYYDNSYWPMLPSILSFVMVGVLFYMLIFRTEVIISKLNLTQDLYEEQFSLNMDIEMVLQVTILAAGIVLLVDAVPVLCKDAITYYQRYLNSSSTDDSAQGLAYSGAKVVAAYIMLANSKYLTLFILKRKAPTQHVEGDSEEIA